MAKNETNHNEESAKFLPTTIKSDVDPLTNNQNYDQIQTSHKKPCINARTTLWYMSFCGFAINYVLRNNLNIAIVGMIKTGNISGNKSILHSTSGSECYNNTMLLYTTNLSDMHHQNDLNSNESTINDYREDAVRGYLFEQLFLDLINVKHDKNGFDWNEYEQGLLLGAFFWFHWVLQIPGGILARKYGTKLIFGVGNFVGCLMCAFIPIVSYLDLRLCIALRVIQGIICGAMWPSMHNMVGKWIPPNERSTFVSSYMGSSFGVGIFYPIFGLIIEYISWEWVFHTCAILGTIWFICWQYFVYDSPAQHPRIDPAERMLIENSLSTTVDDNTDAKIPWFHIFTSLHVWLNVSSLFGVAWLMFTLMAQAPTYFKLILGWNLQSAGFLSGIPHLTRMLFSYLFSVYCDYLLKTNKLSRTNVRRFALFTTNGVAAVFTIILAYAGCSSAVAFIALTLALSVTGGVSAAQFASVVDLSPNFASILLGICAMIAVLPGFISPMIVGKLTLNNQTVQQWQYVFLISAAWGLLSSVAHMIFLNSEVQHWNNFGVVQKSQNLQDNELQELNTEKNETKNGNKL